MHTVDLNCDLGESFGNYKCGLDEEVIRYISSANVACGFHASDPAVMTRTVALARENGVSVGAHPGYPDLQGFGRRDMDASPAEVKAMVQYQIGALEAFCTAQGISLAHVKPHGAMYNMAGRDETLAEAICEGIYEVDPGLVLLGLSGSRMLEAAKRTGLKCAKEVFADRAYEEDGTLVARNVPGALITDEDEAVERVLRIVKDGVVTAITGRDIEVAADSVCIHGDGPKALAFAAKIRKALEREAVRIVPLGKSAG
ncbi:LamB/YcsF family protein [Lachnospiraceae bacterium]|uniref:LamB/YcsF family protein n=1 Tax=Extibacter sp. GGCC_0201 TaxID=2731209 RepID=UPI001AA18E13|nr:5-oxoprolinase subunit PxpA [Extibacter sp. GGCC_0201]MBO1720937.1 LamB/YcsF family protein [Extibacter sp. GGCC_0201]BDF32003.1 LamB/YcsF family protein [Lachnospiraceae bacterium]BDF36016.1 LamB/YcsF family protein [Lachnospiraceae bacterium]